MCSSDLLAPAAYALPHALRAAEPAPLVTPNAAQQAWHDMELGMFFHFDIPIYKPGWNWRSFADFPAPNLYQPTKLDTDQWMEAAQALGAKYAIFVAKHCSGFLQWQSDLYPYGVKQSSWRGGKGDVVGAFVESCRKHGIRPGLYASASANGFLGVDNPGLVNRGKGGDPEAQARYVKICEQMMTELWTRYGDLFEIWFDGGAIPAAKGGPDLVPILTKHQPQAIVFQGPAGTPNLIRWVGNERGVAPYPCWSTANAGTSEGGTVEKTIGGNPDGTLWVPGECDVPVRNHDWFWAPGGEKKLYSVEQLMQMYGSSVGRNCNLLLNANPGPDGLVPEPDLRRYREFGQEIKRRFGAPLATASGAGASIDLTLTKPQAVSAVSIMEDIASGERIRAYEVEGLTAVGAWTKLCDGVSVGHKRIQTFPATEVAGLRLRITASAAEPKIRQFAVLANTEPAAGDFGAPRLLVAPPADARFAHLSWPKIVRAADGTLVLACIAGRKHVNGDGCPAVSVSKDGGKTFSEPRVLATFDASQRYRHAANLALGLAEDGAVVLLAMAFTDDLRNTVVGWRSADAGATWTPVDTSSLADSKTGSVFGHVFPVPGKGLAATGHFRKPKGDGIWMAFSPDSGRSWGEPVTVTGQRLFEPTFTFAQGRLIGLIRDDPAHAYQQLTSDDLGATWQGPTAVLQGDPKAGHPSPFLVADPASPSRLYALQSQRTKSGEIYLWTADAKALQWTRLGLVTSFPGCQDYSYPWMTHLRDNRWLAVFYAGQKDGPNAIFGLELTIPGATAPSLK